MYKIDDKDALFFMLPPNLQDDYSRAFSRAFSKQMKKLLVLANKLQLWTDLDNADPKYYDHMAAALQAPYYNSEMENDKKLALIKNAIQAHTYAGTVKGVEEFLGSVFDSVQIIPWYEYEGDPYHFKVRAAGERTADIDKLFNDMLRKVKAARSILDTIETVRTLDQNTIYGARYFGIRYAPEIEPYEEV